MIGSEIFGKWEKRFYFYEEARKIGIKQKAQGDSQRESLLMQKNNSEKQLEKIAEALEKGGNNHKMFNARMKDRGYNFALIKKIDEELNYLKKFDINGFTELFKENLEYIEFKKKGFLWFQSGYTFFDKALAEQIDLAMNYYYSGNVFPIRKLINNHIKKYCSSHSFIEGEKGDIVKLLKKIDNPYIYGILGEMLLSFFSVKVNYLKLTK